jgi:hypothetical protein
MSLFMRNSSVELSFVLVDEFEVAYEAASKEELPLLVLGLVNNAELHVA